MLLLLCTAFVANAKPNVWLIVADDLGFGDLGYTGSSIKTPVIDALATNGTILGHYYVNLCCTPTVSHARGVVWGGLIACCCMHMEEHPHAKSYSPSARTNASHTAAVHADDREVQHPIWAADTSDSKQQEVRLDARRKDV